MLLEQVSKECTTCWIDRAARERIKTLRDLSDK